MSNLIEQLSPDELMRVTNQIELIKLELAHNVTFESIDESTPPDVIRDFLEQVSTMQELQTTRPEMTVYEKVGRPSFRLEPDLTDCEVSQALDGLMRHMRSHGIELVLLAPDDYTSRTIYRFITDELFRCKVTDMGEKWCATFVYEEFYQNSRCEVDSLCRCFLTMLQEGEFNRLDHCLAERFFLKAGLSDDLLPHPSVTAYLQRLLKDWWPKTVREWMVSGISLNEKAGTAQAAITLHLGVEGHRNTTTEPGMIYLKRQYGWWFIDRIQFDDWVLH